jgi:hypothetical protein
MGVEVFEYLVAGAAVALGWNLGRVAADTLTFWTNAGINRVRVYHWEKRNPTLAARVRAARKVQEEAMLAAAEVVATQPGAEPDHGQYV